MRTHFEKDKYGRMEKGSGNSAVALCGMTFSSVFIRVHPWFRLVPLQISHLQFDHETPPVMKIRF